MVNPGVVKLLSEDDLKKIEINHRFEIEDNIGESIHVHYHNLRLDFDNTNFSELVYKVHQVVDEVINVDAFRSKEYDPLFLMTISEWLPFLKDVEEKDINLEDLWIDICSEDGIEEYRKLKDSRVLRALNGDIDEDNQRKQINSFGYGLSRMSNDARTKEILNSIKNDGYNDNYKIVITESNRIIDGQHRAAALLYLYGNIVVRVKKLIFQENIMVFNNYTYKNFNAREKENLVNFCNNHEEVFLYGAGHIAKYYYEILREFGISVDGFIVSKLDNNDSNRELFGKPIYDVMNFTNNFCNRKYGVVVSFDSRDFNINEIAYWGNITLYYPNHEYLRKEF